MHWQSAPQTPFLPVSVLLSQQDNGKGYVGSIYWEEETRIQGR